MRNIIIILVSMTMLLTACARSVSTPTHEAERIYFESWIKTYYPELVGKNTELGSYIKSDTEGSGELLGDADNTPYYRARFTVRTLDGLVLQTSEEKIARQTGSYQESYFYGPNTFARVNNASYAGVDEIVSTMRVGGKREAFIPGYLITTNRYSSQTGYLYGESSGTDCDYYLEITERITDIVQWETDSLKRYMKKAYHYTDEQCEKDTLKKGYYKVVDVPATGEKFSNDTTIYIDYIARRLDGHVFDTTIEDTAKFYGIYSSSKTYSPITAEINATTYTSTTISSGTSVIDGFSYLLSTMGPFETSTGIFYSAYGYSSSGSGYAIPAYCPLIFQISVVEKPSDD